MEMREADLNQTRNGRPGFSLLLAVFALLLSMWLLASGHYKALIVGFGVLSCAGTVVLAHRMRIIDRESFPVHMLLRGLRYLPFWVKAVVKANIDVARRILSPRMPLSPRVFVLRPTQKTDLGRVIYANSITTTPGTVSIEAEGGTITVHAIAEEVAEELKQGEMDRQVTRMEGCP